MTWFEIDRTGYISYLLSLQSLHHRGWRVKQRLQEVIHILHMCRDA